MRGHDVRAGFTLVEVLVALAIGAVVILGARNLLEGLTLHAQRTIAVAGEADDDAARERLLRITFSRVGIARDSAERFAGTRDESRFASWCDTPMGWQEPCDVQLAVRDLASGETTVVLTLSNAGSATVRPAARGIVFRYLASAADGGHWEDRWEQAITPPLAIAFIAMPLTAGPPETTLVRIGDGY